MRFVILHGGIWTLTQEKFVDLLERMAYGIAVAMTDFGERVGEVTLDVSSVPMLVAERIWRDEREILEARRRKEKVNCA